MLQKLLDIGFCGGKWSEKACYDFGELVFGFDDINNNMVSMQLFSFLGPVHSAPEIFENAALFLPLGLPSTLIHRENGVLRKRSSNRRNLKTPDVRFRVDGKHLKTEVLKTLTLYESCGFFVRVFLNTNPK